MTKGATLEDLLQSVIKCLEDSILPNVKGFEKFSVLMCLKALSITQREIRLSTANQDKELSRLQSILNQNGSIEDLRELICDQISNGKITEDSKELRVHLKATALEHLSIDQPDYSAYLKMSNSS